MVTPWSLLSHRWGCRVCWWCPIPGRPLVVPAGHRLLWGRRVGAVWCHWMSIGDLLLRIVCCCGRHGRLHLMHGVAVVVIAVHGMVIIRAAPSAFAEDAPVDEAGDGSQNDTNGGDDNPSYEKAVG